MSRVVFIGITGYQFPYVRVRCYRFAEQLQKHGFDTEVLSFEDHLAPAEFAGIRMLQLRDRHKLELTAKAVMRLLREKQAWLYVQKVHWHTAAPFLLARLGLNRIILDYDDYDLDRSPLFNRPMLNQILFGANDAEAVTRNVAAKAACCIASSHALRDLLSKYSAKVELVHTGVDVDSFKPAARTNDGTVRFHWNGQVWGSVIYENLCYLTRAFARVYDQIRSVELVIVGGGEWLPVYQEYVKQRFAACPIVIKSWINPDEMPQLVGAMDVGLMPMEYDEANRDWMLAKSPTKFFEYMASGLACVAARRGELQHIVEHGRNALLADNEDEFTDHMVRLATESELRYRIGAAARQTILEHYSLEVLGQRLADIIRSLERGI